jgi:hypothetical protein
MRENEDKSTSVISYEIPERVSSFTPKKSFEGLAQYLLT